ncbi:MAG: FAD-dependent oxidoreductase, partial [Rhodospirillales bacterium]|nr:FAD-dependent oxidoreductase [Rhodospirillales bacterium]
MERIDCIVIGAGVVGLAIARALAQAGREVLVIESADAIGTGTSARNSEVIHAGIYYPIGSLKAKLCVRGRNMLYAYCAERGIEARRVGKLVVATDEAEVERLNAVKARAEACGVDDLSLIDGVT